jgi:hypothetical protein
MSVEVLRASEKEVRFFRAWACCPEDFENTPATTAGGLYRRFVGTGAGYIEAWQLLGYMRGEIPMPQKAFKAIEEVFVR